MCRSRDSWTLILSTLHERCPRKHSDPDHAGAPNAGHDHCLTSRQSSSSTRPQPEQALLLGNQVSISICAQPYRPALYLIWRTCLIHGPDNHSKAVTRPARGCQKPIVVRPGGRSVAYDVQHRGRGDQDVVGTIPASRALGVVGDFTRFHEVGDGDIAAGMLMS